LSAFAANANVVGIIAATEIKHERSKMLLKRVGALDESALLAHMVMTSSRLLCFR